MCFLGVLQALVQPALKSRARWNTSPNLGEKMTKKTKKRKRKRKRNGHHSRLVLLPKLRSLAHPAPAQNTLVEVVVLQLWRGGREREREREGEREIEAVMMEGEEARGGRGQGPGRGHDRETEGGRGSGIDRERGRETEIGRGGEKERGRGMAARIVIAATPGTHGKLNLIHLPIVYMYIN